MRRLKVFAGECEFSATVQVIKEDLSRVSVEVQSPCDRLKAFGEALGTLDFQEVLAPLSESLIFKLADEHLKHNDCPVPTAVIKAILVEMGTAKPRDVVITFEKDGIQTPLGLGPAS